MSGVEADHIKAQPPRQIPSSKNGAEPPRAEQTSCRLTTHQAAQYWSVSILWFLHHQPSPVAGVPEVVSSDDSKMEARDDCVCVCGRLGNDDDLRS
ncbi:hypothetical protein VTG60DRAFT_6155 [Thermothelomyces hinnuleus]